MPEQNPLARHQARIEAIYTTLQAKQTQGKHCYFQVEIDDLAVITRTNKLDSFWDFLPFLDEFTQRLDILCFMGKSYRNTRHTFELAAPPAEKISQAQMDKFVRQRVEKWKQEQEHEHLMTENERLSKRVEALEAHNQELTDLVAELQQNRFNKDNLQVSQIMAFFLHNFPALAEQYPTLKQFGNILGLEAAPKDNEEATA